MGGDGETEKKPKKSKEKKKEEIKKLTEFLGTSSVIKLPYIIGTQEYKKHPFAGVVFLGDPNADE
jgi:hypothetical protein